jgi:ferredoxin-NADP reductase
MNVFQAVVREVVRETGDTVTLLLEADVPRDYEAGQFLNIDPHAIAATRELAAELERRKGKKERPRAYSLASAPHEPLFAITVKEDPPGEYPSLLTPYLVRQVRAGDTLPCAGFAGLYTLPPDLPPQAHIVHVCAGSGIVPNFGIIKDALHRQLPVRHTLLFSNKRWDDVIYREPLTRLETSHPSQLRIIHALTRDPTGAPTTAITERFSEAHLREHVADLADAWFFVCGPSIPPHERAAARARGTPAAPRFLETMRATLLGLGVPKQRIQAEGW